MNVLNKAMKLAYFELLGDANWANEEAEKYNQVSIDDIQRVMKETIVPSNCSTLYYKAKN